MAGGLRVKMYDASVTGRFDMYMSYGWGFTVMTFNTTLRDFLVTTRSSIKLRVTSNRAYVITTIRHIHGTT